MSEPTEDQLRRAWRDLAAPDWGSFEAAKSAALHWGRVRLRACLISRGINPDALMPADTGPIAACIAAQTAPRAWIDIKVAPVSDDHHINAD